MTNFLAIDTSTDACSVAVSIDGCLASRYEVVPRAHSRRLFSMLCELLPSGDLQGHGVEAITWAVGPGSFTGLRIAASAVQGLAFTSGLPVVGISTLACQVRTAVRLGQVNSGDIVLSILDARIGEVYWGLYECQGDGLKQLRGPVVAAPQAVDFDVPAEGLKAVGAGLRYLDSMPSAVVTALIGSAPDILPSAEDLIPLAQVEFEQGSVGFAPEVAPVYVREEVSWKKLAEQGKAS